MRDIDAIIRPAITFLTVGGAILAIFGTTLLWAMYATGTAALSWIAITAPLWAYGGVVAVLVCIAFIGEILTDGDDA